MHTPGPWTFHDDEYCPEEIWGDLDGPDENNRIRGTLVCTVNEEAEQFEANRHLLRAAPDLLKAAKDAVSYLDDATKDNHAEQVAAALSALTAAIAKAEAQACREDVA